jgi:hypothetical protein
MEGNILPVLKNSADLFGAREVKNDSMVSYGYVGIGYDVGVDRDGLGPTPRGRDGV